MNDKDQNDSQEIGPAGEKLQKVLARIGVGSRRDVEAWITQKRIKVNGVEATLGQRVDLHRDQDTMHVIDDDFGDPAHARTHRRQAARRQAGACPQRLWRPCAQGYRTGARSLCQGQGLIFKNKLLISNE